MVTRNNGVNAGKLGYNLYGIERNIRNIRRNSIIQGFFAGVGISCLVASFIFEFQKDISNYSKKIEEGFANPSKLELKLEESSCDGKYRTVLHYDKNFAYLVKFDGNQVTLEKYDAPINQKCLTK